MSDPAAITRDVLTRCAQAGFALSGVAPVQMSRWGEHLGAWLAQGKHGTMEYLDTDTELRLEPARVLDGCRAFLVVGDLYAPRGAEDGPTPPGMGRLARYARGRNYHEVMKRRLHALADDLRLAYPGSEFRTCVDTVPILERELAVLAGLGWQAKNTMVIHPRAGSYFLLGVVATTLPLVANEDPPTDHCGTCTRCIEACPTGAITPYSVDASRCVSYLTIERREPIPREFHAGIGDWLAGCDICQEVCPHNSPRPGAEITPPHPAYTPRQTGFKLLDVLGWGPQEREQAFKTSALKRITLTMIKRNAIIAAGNSLRTAPDAALLARLHELSLSEQEPALVRETARDVLGSLPAR